MYSLDNLLEDIHQDFNTILEQANFCGLKADAEAALFEEVVMGVREQMKGIAKGLAVGRNVDAISREAIK